MFEVIFYAIAILAFIVYALVLIAYPIYAIASFVGWLKQGRPSAIVTALGLASSVIVIVYVTLMFAGILDSQQHEPWSADHGPQ